MIELKVPSPGESITEVQLATWLVADGDFVENGQDIVEIDSDKATLSIAATESGKIQILVEEGETVEVGTVIAKIDETVKGTKKAEEAPEKVEEKSVAAKKEVVQEEKKAPEPKVAVEKTEELDLVISPLARKMLENEGASEAELLEFFKHYRFGKKDIELFLKEKGNSKKDAAVVAQNSWTGGRETERKKLSMLRKKLAQRLVSVKNETAMLTTFNEVNMKPIMDIRTKYKDIFKEQHGIGLGFMSFFTKAVTEAIQFFPQINSQFDGDEIVEFNYVDVGIAVSAPKGLMVPVIRNAEMMTLAQIELAIKDLAIKARDSKITIEEMQGGTFTITNGGVFGSMMSTPILNPPQSAILGMHNIVDRPMAVNGKVEILPMMYLAVSYDHRIIDGRESVGFLVKVKELLENPERMLFGAKDPVQVLLGI
ncbi:MAG TPA: 2-oxoglutarate dehydrogenase complex dihydrolipoyllysine-residue succinyltransferase [Bacteroidales bacterium]